MAPSSSPLSARIVHILTAEGPNLQQTDSWSSTHLEANDSDRHSLIEDGTLLTKC